MTKVFDCEPDWSKLPMCFKSTRDGATIQTKFNITNPLCRFGNNSIL